MSRFRNPDPERVRVALSAVGEVEERRGGFIFRAEAQAYGIVNDRLMLFLPGSGLRTVRERVPAGRVKIHDGHPYDPNSDTIAGRVLSAQETSSGVTYEGFLSSTEEKLATKITEGVIDENSIELHVLREMPMEVDPSEVPEHARRYCEMTSGGKAIIRGIREWMWLAVGLVSGSSQGHRAIIDTPRVVPFQDLPLSRVREPWDPAAAALRVREWVERPGVNPDHRPALLSRAYLCRAGSGFELQIADIAADSGELVVVPEALNAAAARARELMETDPETALALARHIGRYEARLTSGPIEVHTTHNEPGEQPPQDPAEEPIPAADDEPEDLSTTAHEPASQPLTADADAEAAQQRQNQLREMRLRQAELNHRAAALISRTVEISHAEQTHRRPSGAPAAGAALRGGSA